MKERERERERERKSSDDNNVCLTFLIGTSIAGRYHIIEYLGSAAFSSALRCLDLRSNTEVMKERKKDGRKEMECACEKKQTNEEIM
jgi:hypothetical protein